MTIRKVKKMIQVNYLNHLVFIFIFCFCQSIFAQLPNWMSQYEINALKDWKIAYKKPRIFKKITGVDYFENNFRLKKIMVKGCNQLHSKNEGFIVFNVVGAIIGCSENNNMIYVLSENQGTHREHIKLNPYVIKDLEQFFGKKGVTNWKEYVDLYSTEDKAKKFNADNALSYSINLEPKDYYKSEYKNLWVLFIQKKNRGFVRMYCLYKDMPKRKVARYKKKVEKIFRYKD